MLTRSIYLCGFIIIVVLLCISIWLQFFDGFVPCPLCTLQRIAFALFGIWFLFSYLLNRCPSARLLINLLAAMTAFNGAAFAARQVWLQFFSTDANNECGVSVQYMLKALPLNEVAKKVFAGSAECSQRGWKFLYLNMAEWSLLWFVVLFLITGYLILKSRRNNAK